MDFFLLFSPFFVVILTMNYRRGIILRNKEPKHLESSHAIQQLKSKRRLEIEEFPNTRVLYYWCLVFSNWECAQEGEINNSFQQDTAGCHTEERLRIATSLESFRCPRQLFPTESHFCLLLCQKDPYIGCYLLYLAQKYTNCIIPLYFSCI